jgi:hypothetical protein
MYIDQVPSFTELCLECPDKFEHFFLKERVIKSVMAGLCSVFVDLELQTMMHISVGIK